MNVSCVCDFKKEGWSHFRARVSFFITWNQIVLYKLLLNDWNKCVFQNYQRLLFVYFSSLFMWPLIFWSQITMLVTTSNLSRFLCWVLAEYKYAPKHDCYFHQFISHIYACDLINCLKICATNVSENPPGSTFLSCMEVNVNADIAYVCYWLHFV